VGWEALIRWPGSRRSPADFLPVAKASGAIQEITDFVIWEAVAVLDKLPEHHWVSVNISDCLFETQMEAACQHFAVDPSRLRIEVTEDWQPNPTAIARFRYARFIGHPIELDDFWVDRSNVGWIDLLEPVAIKLDRQFVTGAYRDPNKAEICRAAIALAKNYDPPMEVIVEGVETVEDMMFLSGLGADYGQGWLFSRAIPKDELWTLR
jgi:EAL domain-containing protein (putative c-di-GMP-specific phosphodiesterase class I)